MPIQLPNLDDRTYDDLVAEGLHLIPTYAPEWTNYNPSDPGITLIELFAYITELLIYRLDRVTDENKAIFLKLIDAPEFQREPTLDGQIRKTIAAIRTTDRAITRQDFERLALEANSQLHPNDQIARVYCLPKINLLSDSPIANVNRSDYINIIVVPKQGQLSQVQIKTITDYLDKRRLITTRINVVAPVFIAIRVKAKLFLKNDAIGDIVLKNAVDKLRNFFNPLNGGQTKTGWEFGRSIYISEIYQLLDTLSGVDYVQEVAIFKQINVAGELTEIVLKPNELVDFQSNVADIKIRGLQ